ncbi:type I restriction-modification system subunit M [Bradyrhizobium ontarionense]|uniref:site-specific DNA-methyltransferase (adenine-specific) n=2 Tax=Bradyrhizobium ontarionense TaxID=2898149 RepID=A0ABY3R5L7_9BRAD|nr:type I restriction-modification system subunit M [Bradyrhizobium sp. A19]UFZ02600.1 type I restriction-modification system subunit M [Bradyrhizobium sp. A19]
MDDIKRVAWAACNTFRGLIDPAEYKDYILIMLFLKFISDVWKQHLEDNLRDLKGDEVRVQRRMQRERFVMPEGSTFDELHAARDSDNIGERVDIALEAIESTNKAKLGGVFRNVSFNSATKLGETKDRNRRIKNLLDDFAKLDLRPGHVVEDEAIGEAYIYLIERFASEAGKKAGEFYTPLQVSRVLAKLVAPKSGERICDPACGSGSLLIETAYEVGSKDFALFGQEVNGGTHALAKLNMFLHDIDGARIEWGDTLNNPQLIEDDKLAVFDIVVANPPFSLKKWGGNEKTEDGKPKPDRFNRWHRGLPPPSTGDWAFITHMVETAKPKLGRVAVVVPHGVLFRGGAEGKIREAMIRENLLDAVIGLPSNLFQSTSIPVAVLVFDRRREKSGARAETTDVLFIDASRDFKQAKTQNILESAHTAKIIETYNTRKDVERYARDVPAREIAENGFNLNIPRYVDTFEAETEVDVRAVQVEIEQLEAELLKVRERMVGYLKELGVDA